MRMCIYHNFENNQLEAYVLADEGRTLSGQKKSIREALPECVAELRKLCIDRAAAAKATIHVDGYGVIAVTWYNGRMAADVRLHAGSRERLCNRKLARNKDVEVPTSDDLASALATVLRSESACRRANDLDTAVRFDYPAESADRVLVAVGEGDGWAEPEPESVETVEVEPVEIEHDGVMDVEMVETAETPTAAAVNDDYQQYVGMWAFGSDRVYVCTDGTVWQHFDHHDKGYESWVKQVTPSGSAATVCDTFVDRGWTHVSREADSGVPHYVTDSDAAATGTVCADDAASGWQCDGMDAVTRDYANVPVTRMVESAPQLPAECEAVTQEIPEVPPQTNADAHVLTVSEHVIPTLMTVGDMFKDVPYRAVHAIKRAVERRDGSVTRKKVAYVFRFGGVVHVVRRDRYDVARDQAVEAEIAAYVAKLSRAA